MQIRSSVNMGSKVYCGRLEKLAYFGSVAAMLILIGGLMIATYCNSRGNNFCTISKLLSNEDKNELDDSIGDKSSVGLNILFVLGGASVILGSILLLIYLCIVHRNDSSEIQLQEVNV